jgi:NAD(P)H-hydrate epimerase
MRIHTSSELREIDQHAARDLGVPTALLMENAGRAVAEAAREEALRRRGRVLVVCGKGNNGGDGYVAARHLKAAGLDVHVIAVAPPESLSGDAALNAKAARACGILSDGALGSAGPDDVVIDAVFGTGLTRPPEGQPRDLIRDMTAAHGRGAFVVAVDLPSGLNADLPIPPGDCVQADRTVSLHSLKPAVAQYPGRAYCGEVQVASLGIPTTFAPGPVRRWLTRETVAPLLPRRAADAHKGTNGHLLVVAGSIGKSGAAHMACAAALRSGAGLVTLAAPAEVIDRVLPRLPEAMGHAMPAITGDALLAALDRKDALAIGPGIERTENTGRVLVELLSHMRVPTLIDADGLNALSADQASLQHLSGAMERPVLTPHPAELARLLASTTADVQRDRFAAATTAAQRFGAHVVLKGACSVIAHPDGSLDVNSTGNAAMSTAGMGDVLSGVCGALLAQRLAADATATLATFVHGRAGDLAHVGQRGLLALDVADKLPQAFAELE